MIKTSSLSVDTSTSSQTEGVQSGVTGKVKKGKGAHQSLFSKLLTTLQHGNPSKQSSTSAKEVKINNLDTKGVSQKEGKLASKHTTPAPQIINITPNKQSIKHIAPLTTPATEKKVMAVKDIDSSDVIAVVQEPQLTIQKPKSNKAISDVAPQIRKKTNTSNLNNNPNLSLQEGNPDKLRPQAEQTHLKVSAKTSVSALPADSPQKRTSLLTHPAPQLKPVVETKTSGPFTTINNTPDKKAGISLTPMKEPLTTKEEAIEIKAVFSSRSSIEETAIRKQSSLTVTTTKVEESLDDNPKPYINILQASSLKQPSNKPQLTSQGQEQSISLLQSSSSNKGIDTSSSGAQQDFTSNQQDVTPSLFDTNKPDTKVKGAEFQAQLAYRAQRTFTPADTMLEIVKSAKDGSTSLELQLEPANLGKVQVSIQLDSAKQIQVAFTVDQNASRQALEQHMPQLRQALAQQGLDLGSFSMQMNQQGSQQEQKSFSRQLSSENEQHNETFFDTTQQTRIGINTASDGRLSILA